MNEIFTAVSSIPKWIKMENFASPINISLPTWLYFQVPPILDGPKTRSQEWFSKAHATWQWIVAITITTVACLSRQYYITAICLVATGTPAWKLFRRFTESPAYLGTWRLPFVCASMVFRFQVTCFTRATHTPTYSYIIYARCIEGRTFRFDSYYFSALKLWIRSMLHKHPEHSRLTPFKNENSGYFFQRTKFFQP